ncbi:MAG TPA: pyridoxal-phosphate dependent enzyme [Candidatus Hydrogenedentes bacterium]|nr:pyridoxal-phosphate dependent enzyme [Candidatus Hydrogenedentota bacterium]HPG69983.1 pyridoxal-phosphate dependent enzyme [Candidatus Hydrogenedentota bacterium]
MGDVGAGEGVYRGKMALFERFPALAARLPHVALGQFPTPVERLDALGASQDMAGLYVKRDDVSGPVYGGNKIRKLEFLFGRALERRAKAVMTFGCAGSNHALATAVYARSLGLRSISILIPQTNAAYVRRNLLFGHHVGAELRHFSGPRNASVGSMLEIARSLLTSGRRPFIIPMGGSSPLGTVGFVGAGLELAGQVAEGVLPAPDALYVAMGTMGTAAGIALGLRAAGLDTRVVPVRVVPTFVAHAGAFVKLFRKTNALLRNLDPTFPDCAIAEDEVGMRDEFFGEGYARFTEVGMAAVRRARAAGIHLEGTYTGKTFAALLRDAESGALRGKNVVFWNTSNSRDFSAAIEGIDYHDLPAGLHPYFEKPCQPLDAADS